jgi:acetyl-CoA decarbonylase/synthase complex subunit delta
MEVSTATSTLVGGANAVVVRHPKSVETIKELVSAFA